MSFLDGRHLDHALAEARADWPLGGFVEDIDAPPRSFPSTRLTAPSSIVSAIVDVPWALR